jgi:hypothetical protein
VRVSRFTVLVRSARAFSYVTKFIEMKSAKNPTTVFWKMFTFLPMKSKWFVMKFCRHGILLNKKNGFVNLSVFGDELFNMFLDELC